MQTAVYTDLRFRALGYEKGVLMDVGGTDSAPQVDHIVPERRTGVNAFSNAQLLSSAYNNFKKSQMSGADALALAERIYGARAVDPKVIKGIAARMSKQSDTKKKRLEKLKAKSKSASVQAMTRVDLINKVRKRNASPWKKGRKK